MSPRAQKLEQVPLLYGNWVLRKDESLTYLGVKLDPGLSLKTHVLELADKAAPKLIILKKLASTNWGSRFQTLRQLYLGRVRAIMNHVMPVSAFIAPTNLKPLQRGQN